MADAYEFGKEKKKRTFKKIDKDIGNFEIDSMRTPPNNFSKTPTSRYKGTHISTSNLDDQSNNYHSVGYWDKRSSGRRYHGDSEYRGGYGRGWRFHENSKERYGNDTGRPPGTEEPYAESPPMVTPVILTRERNANETKTTSANVASTPQPKESETPKNETSTPPVRQYQIASKANVLETIVVPEQVMSSSIKLLDDSLLLGEDFSPYLLDQSHFLVLAVVGLQASGKSTVASLLADPSKGLKFTTTRSWIFRPECRDEVLRGCHATSGIDTYITKERVIILDLQPLLSPSVMDFVVTQERKASLDYSSSTENLLEVESLQLLTFAMSVAHALVVVQDYIIHPNLIRLLHTCQMMKPSHSASSSAHNSSSGLSGARDGISRSAFDGSDVQQYFPHLVFVHNRAFPHQFVPKSVEELQLLYQLTLADSSLCLESQIGICSGTFSPPLGSFSSNININLFLVPDVHHQDRCSVSFMESILEMRRQLFSLSRCPLTHVTLTEKSWYQYACRMWESIRKSSLYVEYSRLLP